MTRSKMSLLVGIAFGVALLVSSAEAGSEKVTRDWSGDWKTDHVHAEAASSTYTFEWTGNHDVKKFPDKASYDACDFSNAVLIGATSPQTVNFPAADKMEWYACSIGSHCTNNQKVMLHGQDSSTPDAAPGSAKVTRDWSGDWKTDHVYAKVASSTYTFEWTGNHDVKKFPDKASYDACDFSKAVLIGATSPQTVNFPAADKMEFYACSIGSHCTNNQKVMLHGQDSSKTHDHTDGHHEASTDGSPSFERSVLSLALLASAIVCVNWA